MDDTKLMDRARVHEAMPQPALALAFDAAVAGQALRLRLAGAARHAADAAIALDGMDELLVALDAWCGTALDWCWEPQAGARRTDAQVALRWGETFVHLLGTWEWLRTLAPPPAALADRLHWPPVPVVVNAGLLRLETDDLQQLEAGGAVVLPASMHAPWAGALRGADEAPERGIALELGTPAAPRLLPRPATLAATGSGDVLCEVRLDAPAALSGEQLTGWHEGTLELGAFDGRASLWRCAGAGTATRCLAGGRLLPWGAGWVLRLETVEV